ncbi:MAG: aryl-sulfate sulfotransferase [Planctomycetes bacterium]|nr:aryl-sulfate sulfotransferase [Planctomycetota bacterium]
MAPAFSPADRDRWPRRLFCASALALTLGYGVLAGMFGWFPQGLFARAAQGFGALVPGAAADREWYFKTVRTPSPPPIANSGRAQPGLNLVTAIGADALEALVLDLDGKQLHRWSIDWFQLWPDASHVPERLRPQSRPGTHIDGAVLLEDGDLVFHFEHLGMMRLDAQGQVVWRLPYQTHHSITRGDDGNLWVCGQKEHTVALPEFPSLLPPFVEDTILEVSPEGRILREWSVPGLLRQNGREGLLCLANTDNFSTAESGDVTHLNHVEPFPARLPAGEFGPGSVLVSLRNVNTVFVFDSRSGRMQFVSTGQFVRQHDPHFLDGNTISVFDNHVLGPADPHPQSRILLLHAPDQAVKTYFAGTPEQPFFTPILGRHQWLPNGHLLITDSCNGRAFELDRNLQVVWWYIHYVGEGVVGAVEQVTRIPSSIAAAYR